MNPPPGQPWERISLGQGMSRVFAGGLLLGHVRAEPEGWYASVLQGDVFGPFETADVAAQVVYDEARRAPHMEALQINPDLNLKKLKARLLR